MVQLNTVEEVKARNLEHSLGGRTTKVDPVPKVPAEGESENAPRNSLVVCINANFYKANQ